jgi:hypothetical protein
MSFRSTVALQWTAAFALAACLAAFAAPARAQHIICCNSLIDVKGDWVGASRDCSGKLAQLAPPQRAAACDALKRDAPFPGARCSVAGPCYEDDKVACDPKHEADFKRKEQKAMELFQHASDLRMQALNLLSERLAEEFAGLRFEAEKDVAMELAWEDFGRHVVKGMRDSRAAAQGWIARGVSTGATAANILGWLEMIASATARGYLTRNEYLKIMREADTAQRAAEELWRKALVDFENHLKSQPDCLAKSRAAAEAEKKLDKAKQMIEEWENNQVLYRDPITREALTYEAALKRAIQLMDGGTAPRSSRPFFLRASTGAKAAPSKEALQAAVKELDVAIASFGRLHKSIAAYLRTEREFDARLRATLGQKPRPQVKLPAKRR